jgi:hypothetical protein
VPGSPKLKRTEDLFRFHRKNLNAENIKLSGQYNIKLNEVVSNKLSNWKNCKLGTTYIASTLILSGLCGSSFPKIWNFNRELVYLRDK